VASGSPAPEEIAPDAGYVLSMACYFYPNINGWAYITSVIQHPYGESDQDKLTDPADARGYNGYVGPMPAVN
jgi:hypothetical protein